MRRDDVTRRGAPAPPRPLYPTHLLTQGFNLYHRNRLIKAMWQVYKAPSSVGRGVVGVLEVDFVEPSHDKQDRD